MYTKGVNLLGAAHRIMGFMLKLSLFLVLLGVSMLKQQAMKIIIMVEFMYLCVIGLLLGKVGGWLIILLMVFTALEGVVGLTLLTVMGKYKMGLGQSKFYNW
uniref:NADH dehydrogenase subunit 4L n=1 Tax=Doliolum nationalis TaxID=76841 RepID=Q5KT45_DOLNA|nr:NADH dehydrogenase subunit 4L [Doliolum nationalis]